MGGPKDFLLQFDRTSKVYYPGDVVSGQLVINLKEQKSFIGLKVELVEMGEMDHRTICEEYVDHGKVGKVGKSVIDDLT